MLIEELEKLIEKLPVEFQGLARTYIAVLIKMNTEELRSWMLNIRHRNWQPAYEALIDRMTVDEKIYELERCKKNIAGQNVDMAWVQESILLDVLLIAVQIWLKKFV